MAKSKNEKSKAGKTSGQSHKVVTRNRRASYNYELLEEVDCGVVLMGSEVKSIRNGKVIIDEAYGRIQNGELWLLNADIAEYPQASFMNHLRQRERKLLLRKAQLRRFLEASLQKGLAFVPVSVFFERGFVKVRMAIGKGRKTHDKRQQLKEKSDNREMRIAKQVRVDR